jgi:hypothetical protein
VRGKIQAHEEDILEDRAPVALRASSPCDGVVTMRISIATVEGYKWLALTPRELSSCPTKYVLVHVCDEGGRRIYMFPESFADP